RVFVVEDHPVMRDAIARLLRRHPDLVLAGMAGSAEEALAVIGSAGDESPAPDRVVTNVGLPGMDGCTLVERLCTLRPEMAAVVISSDDEELLARRALAAGARSFVGKLDLAAVLPAAIREAWGSGGDGRGGSPVTL